MPSPASPESPTIDLVEELPVAVVVTDSAGDVLGMNGAATALVGLSREKCLGKNLASFIHPQSHDGEGRLRSRLRLQDGSYRTIEVKRRALADGRVVTVLHDVTATLSDVAALRESEQQLQFVANTVPALLAFVDSDARYVWVNESYRRWFGLAPEAIRGRHAKDVVGEAHWDEIREHVERALTGEEVVFDHRAIFRYGGTRDVHVAYMPHRDAGGRVDGFVVLVTDVTEIKGAERALRRSEHMLAKSQLAARVGSWEAELDRDQKRISLVWSGETYRIFGWDPGVAIDHQRFLQAIHPDDREATVSSATAAIARGGPFEKEYRIVRPDGSVRVIQAWTTVEKDAGGRPVRLFGTCQDVTERRLAELELKEADRRKDEFLAMLSHELRNPLAPMLTAVEILRHADPGDPELSATYRGVIERQVHLMKRLLDDLLDVARVSQGKIMLRKEPLDLREALRRAVEVSRPLLDEKQQRLSVTCAPGTILVDADATRIVQVFANLLNNAAKYSERDGHIELAMSATEDEALVRVRDDGMGMPPELLERVFDLFVQETRSLDRAQGGLGIGLTMVRNLVRMHGGSVRAFSDGMGRGSEVVVRLPRVAPDARTSSESVLSAPASLRTSSPLRVLVVDDNRDAAKGLGDLLTLIGHQVTVARDGPTALAAVAAADPELVLIDIGLPVMDGYAVAAALRGAGLDRAVLVAVTGYGRDDDLRRSREAGFAHHLVKPIDLATLQRITTRQGGRDASSSAADRPGRSPPSSSTG